MPCAIGGADSGVSVRGRERGISVVLVDCIWAPCSVRSARADWMGPDRGGLHGLKICWALCYCALIVGALAVVFLRLRAVRPSQLPYRSLDFQSPRRPVKSVGSSDRCSCSPRRVHFRYISPSRSPWPPVSCFRSAPIIIVTNAEPSSHSQSRQAASVTFAVIGADL